MEIIICPHCHEVMVVFDDDIFCDVCLRQYQLVNDVLTEQPVILCERN